MVELANIQDPRRREQPFSRGMNQAGQPDADFRRRG